MEQFAATSELDKKKRKTRTLRSLASLGFESHPNPGNNVMKCKKEKKIDWKKGSETKQGRDMVLKE